MNEQYKYLVTTNAHSGEVIRVERLGITGELVEVPIETLPGLQAPAHQGTGDVTPMIDGELEHTPGVFVEPDLHAHTPGVFIEPAVHEHAPGVFLEPSLRE